MSPWMWIVALIPPLFYGISNLLDKMVVHGDSEDNNSWAIVALGVIFDIVILIPVGFCSFTNNGYILPTTEVFWPLFLNGIFFSLASWLFYETVKKEDTSRAIAVLQVIPIFGIFLGSYGLEEKLGWNIIIAIVLLVTGGYVLSVSKGKISRRMLGLMLLSAVCYAVNDCIVAKFGRELIGEGGSISSSTIEALPAIFADLMGKMFFGLIPLVGRKQRASFFLCIKNKIGLVALCSLTYGTGDVAFDIAKILAPLAIVQALCCTQPIFVLIGAVLLTIFCKGFPKEEVDEESLVRKTVGIVLMVVGGILLSF